MVIEKAIAHFDFSRIYKIDSYCACVVQRSLYMHI